MNIIQSNPVVDLSNCDREPIQFVNAIQPHGALLVLDAQTLKIRLASANCGDMLGICWDSLIDQQLASLLGDGNSHKLRVQVEIKSCEKTLLHVLKTQLQSRPGTAFHVFANLVNGLVVLEFEPVDETCLRFAQTLFIELRDVLQNLQHSNTLEDFFAIAVEKIGQISRFDHVMAYRFADDGSGEVIAEAKAENLASYLGLHFPASDIPEPARRLFALSALRHLPDVEYTPVPLLPADNGVTVDLSYANLRSVSIMYTGYLRNMGAHASLVMPLFSKGKLWGLISCQHSTAYYLPYEQRIPLEFLAQMVSQMVENRESQDQQLYRSRLERTLAALQAKMDQADTPPKALVSGEINLLSEIDASGAALLLDAQIFMLGKTPSQNQLQEIITWLSQQNRDIFSSRQLEMEFQPAAAYPKIACGILAIRLARNSNAWLIWFRPELLQNVHWAGDPNKPVLVDEINGEIRLQPRASFALWQEEVRGKSRPWQACEIEYATKLRHAIFGMLVERAWLLKQMNAELERSNLELDTFAYAASHDMKEPLRSIHNLVEFIKMEDSEKVSEKGRQRLDTILRISEHMSELLEALLQYSRIDKNKLEFEYCNLTDIASQAAKLFEDASPNKDFQIAVHKPLPQVRGDPLLINMVLQNLFSNALKYNDKPEKRIEMGCLQLSTPPVFYVRDNGIGIPKQQQKIIFELFRRLHSRDEFGGGSGAGLAIVKRIIKRHKGRIWLESNPECGSTFFFTLAPSLPSE